MSTTSSDPFPFLELPPELREKIYIFVCHQSAPISLHIPSFSPPEPRLDPSSTPQTSFPHALLQTCTLIYNELRPIYFTHNTFSLNIRRRNDDWAYFLSPAFQDNRRQIRSLNIIIYRFGSHDFFTKKFCPILEDCIMNGRLRDLDVTVKKAFLRKTRYCEEALRGGFRDSARLETLSDWLGLKKVLLDPYLERRVLRSGNLDGVGITGALGGRVVEIRDVTHLLSRLGIEQGRAYGGRLFG